MSKHCFWFVTVLGMIAAVSWAQTAPNLLNYQGKLSKEDGTPLDVGEHVIVFRIWKNETGTDMSNDLLWVEKHGAVVVNTGGLFNVILGSAAPLTGFDSKHDLTNAFTGSPRFMGITVDTEDPGHEILPRQQILSAPYALNAMNGVPAGSIQAFAGPVNKVPSGWMVCDGRPVKSSEYGQLFAAIGRCWGDGSENADGTPEADVDTDFNLPDLHGRFLRGLDSGTGRDLGVTSRSAIKNGGNTGDNVGSLQDMGTKNPGFTISQAPNHQHHTNMWAPYRWGRETKNGDNQSWNPSGSSSGNQDNCLTSSAGGHAHTIGGGDPETRPINASVIYIIKY